ncbi:MAG: hypothetical protein LBU41_05795, partial [Clostridiales Family XIII bacterium]|nr:hypothetical protein [Clostridiales Family XIII bacterium]
MYCKTCGNILRDGDTVCNVCGAKVAESVPQKEKDQTVFIPKPTPVSATYPDASAAPGIPSAFTPMPPPQPVAEPQVKSSNEEAEKYTDSMKFYWNNKGFTSPQETAENVEIKWDAEAQAKAQAQEQVKAISIAARENAEAEQANKRVEQAREIFAADAFPPPPEEPKGAAYEANKGNEAFQEVLDEKFEKMQEKQASIDESRNRLSDFAMTPEVDTPATLIQSEPVVPSAEDRISAFLAHADKDMLEALERQMQTIKSQEESDKKVEDVPVVATTPAYVPPVVDSTPPVVGTEEQSPPVFARSNASADEEWDFMKASSSYEPVVHQRDEASVPPTFIEEPQRIVTETPQVPIPEQPVVPTPAPVTERSVTDTPQIPIPEQPVAPTPVPVTERPVIETPQVPIPEQVVTPTPTPTPAPAPTTDRFAAFSIPREEPIPSPTTPIPEQAAPQSKEPYVASVATVEDVPKAEPALQPTTDYESMFLPQAPVNDVASAPTPEVASAFVDRKTTTATPKDIINKPIIFPFDEEDFLSDSGSGKVELNKPETEESLETVVAAREKTANKKKEKPAKEAKEKKSKEKPAKRKHSGLVITILIDILIILAVLLLACFAILKIAPESSVGKIINEGATKIISMIGLDKSGDKVDVKDNDNAANGSMVSETSDKETLITGQLYNNVNSLIANVYYDSEAKYRADMDYPMGGLNDSESIKNNLWTEDERGPILYDETAVGTVIRFNALVMDYIDNGNADVLSDLLEGSEAEGRLSEMIGTMEYYSIDSLGIGEIRRNGDEFFVWTIEKVTETQGGISTEKTLEKVYKLVPSGTTMKVSDY